MIFTSKVKIGLEAIGKNNNIKNNAIIKILEDVGSCHSDLVGYGVNNIQDTKLSWILLDWKLKILKRPQYGQELTVNTWGRNMNRFFTYRDYEIYNENNELCIIATSKWALIDIEKEKMARITQEVMKAYKQENGKNIFGEEKISKIEIPKTYKNIFKYKVLRRDIDLNNHMHNVYYLDLAYEALPKEVYNKRPFDNVKISYKREIKLGDIINCKYVEIEDRHIIVITNSDDTIIHSIIELRK